MCGILGYFSKKNSSIDHDEFLDALNSINYRGPDDTGVKTIETENQIIFLGHKRLSIIDLSKAGHQPISSEDGRYDLVYNGEIYNYKEIREELKIIGYNFKTNSDTEVLLIAWQHWEQKALSKFEGMFAFAIYDNVEKYLILVRDPFGIKPLYYSFINGIFSFSSEIRPLLKLNKNDLKKINLQTSFDYLVHGIYGHNSSTFFSEVYSLPPGNILKIKVTSNKIISLSSWWELNISEDKNLSFESAIFELKNRFLKNIEMHLRSDVPIGAALSGGIDSSSIVCAMRHIDSKIPIHTFSFVSPNSKFDESKWIDCVNNYTNAVPHKVIINPFELEKDIDDMIKVQGEPFLSSSIYAQYRVYKAAREAGIIVTLDGQGADELIGGYVGFPKARLMSFFESCEIFNGIRYLYNWSNSPGNSFFSAIKILTLSLIPNFISVPLKKIYFKITLPNWINSKYVFENKIDVIESIVTYDKNIPKGRNAFNAMKNQITGYGLPALLRHGDRNSMRWSVESRVPFLTKDFAEFCFKLPENFILPVNAETKYLFRESMRGIVPNEILDRKDKIGFETPELEWLKLISKSAFEWIKNADQIPFLNKKECQILLEKVLSGEQRYDKSVWRIINYCRWAELMLK
jgi:asparagine synthase (glutamine-hydrolysing)